MIDFSDPYFKLTGDIASDIERIARELPAIPATYSELRSLMERLPKAQEVTEFSARGTPSATADELTFAEQSLLAGPGPSSLPSSSVAGEQTWVGMPNLIADQLLEGWNWYGLNATNVAQTISETHQSWAYNLAAWKYWSDDVASPGDWNCYLSNYRDDLSIFNSSEIYLQKGSYNGSAGTFTATFQSYQEQINYAAGSLPYLVAACRVGPKGLVGSQTARTVTLQIWNNNTSTKVAESVFDLGAQTSGDYYRVSTAYAVPYAERNHYFYIRVVFSVTCGTYQFASWSFGDPQMHSAPGPSPLTFSPNVTNWYPNRVAAMWSSGGAEYLVISRATAQASEQFGFEIDTDGSMYWGKKQRMGLALDNPTLADGGYVHWLEFWASNSAATASSTAPDRLSFRTLDLNFGTTSLWVNDNVGNAPPIAITGTLSQVAIEFPAYADPINPNSGNIYTTNARLWNEAWTAIVILDGGTALDRLRQMDPGHIWLFNEASGDFADTGYSATRLGMGEILTASGSMSYAVTGPYSPGVTMGAIHLTGGRAYNTAVGTTSSSGYVVQGWFKIDSYTDTRKRLFHAVGNSGGSYPQIGIEIDYQTTGKSYIWVTTGSTGNPSSTWLINRPTAGVWHFIQLFHSGQPWLYIDGVYYLPDVMASPSFTSTSLSVSFGADTSGNYVCDCYLSSWALFDTTRDIRVTPWGQDWTHSRRIWNNQTTGPAVFEIGGEVRLQPSRWALPADPTILPALSVNLNRQTYDRFRIMSEGRHEWGPGSTATDLALFRDGTGYLTLKNPTTGAGTSHVYLNITAGSSTSGGEAAIYLNATGATSVSYLELYGSGTNGAAQVALIGKGTGIVSLGLQSGFGAGWTYDQLLLGTDGATGAAYIKFAPGNATWDLRIQRTGTKTLTVDDAAATKGAIVLNLLGDLVIKEAATTDVPIQLWVGTETYPRLEVAGDGAHWWSPGSGAADVRMLRSATKTLAFDDGAAGAIDFNVVGNIQIGGVVMLERGTSFPGSPATGDHYYRTDRNREYYYDGTRWLTTTEYAITGVILDAFQPLTVTGNTDYAAVDAGDNGMYITRIVVSSMVATTNDGTNYWTVQPQSRTGASVTHNVGSSFSTSGDTANVWTLHTTAPGVVVTSGDIDLILACTKTSAPGGFYAKAIYFYRLIG